MSGLTRRIRGASKFLNDKFDPQRATEESGIKYITKVGQLSDRVTACADLSISEEEVDEVDRFISWSAVTWESAVPYFRAQSDNFFAMKIQAYLRMHKYFIYVKHRLNERENERDSAVDSFELDNQIFRKLAKSKFVEADYKFHEDEEEKPEEDEAEEATRNPYPDADVSTEELRMMTLLRTLTSKIHSQKITIQIEGLRNTVNVLRYDMLEMSKYLIAISFNKEDVEPAKTLVISKPEIQQRLAAPPNMNTSQQLGDMQKSIRRISAHIKESGQPAPQD